MSAHILDLVRLGGDVPESMVTWALYTMGDLTNCAEVAA